MRIKQKLLILRCIKSENTSAVDLEIYGADVLSSAFWWLIYKEIRNLKFDAFTQD